MRAMATIGAVEIQQAQVRAIAVLGAAGIFEIRWLAAGMQNLHVNQSVLTHRHSNYRDK
jgi:hypothetical protein